MIEIKVDTREVERYLTDLQRNQLPFATSLAINNTARDVQDALAGEMSVFDRPKPATRKGTFVKSSDKRNLTAIIGLKSRTGTAGVAGSRGAPLTEYLQAQVEGGGRADKRSELLLQRAGILPAGYQTRPGSGARLDAYGNMSRGQIVQILSYFKTFGGIETSGRNRNKTTQSAKLNRGTKRRAAVEYFIVPEGMPGLATGVWQRKGRNVAPILIFIKPSTYRKRYDFYGVARKTIAAKLDRHLDEALRRAIATAK